MIPSEMPASARDRSTFATSGTLLHRMRDPGDSTAWNQFVELYGVFLERIANRAGLIDADALDVVQETMTDVARAMPQFAYDRKRGAFRSWLLTIVYRRIRDRRRKQEYHLHGQRLPRQQRLDTELAESLTDPDKEFTVFWEEEWSHYMLQTAMEILKREVDPLRLQIFQLHVFKEIPARDVAKRMGVKLTEVYWAKYQVQKRLKAVIAAIES